MHINQKGLDLIKKFEGCELTAYLCPAGVVTIGYGHTATARLGQVISEAEAEALLREDVKEAEDAVDRLVLVPLTDDEFSALVSFVFNVGSGAFEESTLLSMINAEAKTAPNQFLRWNKGANREELQGLTRRRYAERALFMGENWKTY